MSQLYHTFANKSRRSLVYHPQLGAVYHQCGALYIIKPQENTRWRVMRYSPEVLMICQACGLNKKFDKSKLVEFFVKGGQKRYFQEFSYGLELLCERVNIRKINL